MTKLEQSENERQRLPEGVPVYINKPNVGEFNGTAMTYVDRLERDKAIARAAFIQARQRQWQADDYLNSEEFKKLIKG